MSKTKIDIPEFKFVKKDWCKFLDVINNVEYICDYNKITVESIQNLEVINIYFEEFIKLPHVNFQLLFFYFKNIRTENLDITMFKNSDCKIVFDNCVIQNFMIEFEVIELVFIKQCDTKIIKTILNVNKEILDGSPILYFESCNGLFQIPFSYETIRYPLPKIPKLVTLNFQEIEFDEELIDFIDDNINKFGPIYCYDCKKDNKKYIYQVNFKTNVETNSSDFLEDLSFF